MQSDMLAMYQTVRPLPVSCGPAYVKRKHGKSLLAVNPRATRLEISEWMADNMWPEELEMIRRAYMIAPLGEPAPEWVTADQPALLYVSPELRLPGEHALQGGAVLHHRMLDDDLHEELCWLDLEVTFDPTTPLTVGESAVLERHRLHEARVEMDLRNDGLAV